MHMPTYILAGHWPKTVLYRPLLTILTDGKFYMYLSSADFLNKLLRSNLTRLHYLISIVLEEYTMPLLLFYINNHANYFIPFLKLPQFIISEISQIQNDLVKKVLHHQQINLVRSINE